MPPAFNHGGIEPVLIEIGMVEQDHLKRGRDLTGDLEAISEKSFFTAVLSSSASDRSRMRKPDTGRDFWRNHLWSARWVRT